jgi:hypothetical protein
MKKYFLLMLISLSINSHAWDSPDMAVSELIKFDLDGGRLTSEKWDIYTSMYLAGLPEDYEEPGWDQVTIVKSYKISNVECSGNVCSVEVEFELFPTEGLKNGQFIEHPKGGIEKVVYTSIKEGLSWKVQTAQSASGIVGPHISITTYKNF